MNQSSSSSSSCATVTDASSVPTTFLGLLILQSKLGFSTSSNYTSSELLRDFTTREFNAFLWLFLIVITTVLLSKVFNIFALWYRAKAIPGLPSPSFFGHCKLLSKDNFTGVLSESHEKYGSIVKLWLGPTQLLVSVKDPILIQEMLIKAKDKVPFTGKAFHLAFGQSSLFAPSYEKVEKRRELLGTELNDRLLKSADLIPTKVADFIIDKIENLVVEKSIDCSLVSQHMAFTLMGTTFFGDGFLEWPKAAIYEELLMNIAKDACFWASYNVAPFWKQAFWRYQCLCTKLRHLTQDILQVCRNSCKILGHQNVHSESSNLEMKSADSAQYCSDDESQNYFFFWDLSDKQNAVEESCGNILRLASDVSRMSNYSCFNCQRID